MSTTVCASCGSPRVAGARYCTRCGATVSLSPSRRTGARILGRGVQSDLLYVVIAALLAVVLSHLPLVSTIIYPFKLFGTFVHEWCHALVAIATGGSVVQLQINGDLSGETFTRGGWTLLIYSAGYVGAAVSGALLLLSPTRVATRTLVGVGFGSLLMPLAGALLFGTAYTANTWLWTLVFGAVTLAIGLRARPRVARLFQQFVAVELCFTAVDSLRDLLWLSFNAQSSVFTDAIGAGRYTGISPDFWAILWTILAVAAIGLSLSRVVRRSIG